MWFYRRSARIILSIGLAILFAVLSILRLPQIALSQVSDRFNSSIVIAGKPPQNVENQFRQRFICVTTSAELSLASSDLASDEQIRKKIVLPLAEKLEPCIRQNRDRIGTVDIKKLVGVTYTVDRTAAVVMVGVGINAQQNAGNGSTNQGTTGGAPNNGITVKITNANEVDGAPLTVGSTVNLSAIASSGSQDLSGSIVWQNKESQVLGKGATLTYRPTQAKNETLKAKVQTTDGRENWDIVSFTISTDQGSE